MRVSTSPPEPRKPDVVITLTATEAERLAALLNKYEVYSPDLNLYWALRERGVKPVSGDRDSETLWYITDAHFEENN